LKYLKNKEVFKMSKEILALTTAVLAEINREQFFIE
jgi:hypothetical protein